MPIAVVGARAAAINDAAGIGAETFPALRGAAARRWSLLALTRDAACAPCPHALRAHSLLLPGDCDPTPARRAGQVIGYGFSPRDTLTLSSLAGAERMLCLQRSVVTLRGAVLEPQELALPRDPDALADEEAMLAALLRLLCAP